MKISVADAVRYMGAGKGNEEVRRMAEETAAEKDSPQRRPRIRR